MTRASATGRWLSLATALTTICAVQPMTAQTLGTVRWQLQPFCNAVTVTVVQNGTVYTLDGFDDQCGAPQRAPLVGLATPNPDGTIGLGLHVVTAPGGRGLQIDARIDLASLGGPWSDSAGNSGTFAFGAAAGGPARPLPTIPSAMIAPASITAAQLAPGAINAAAAAFGACPAGQYLRGLQVNGTVLCEPLGTPTLSTTVDNVANVVGVESSLAIGSDQLPVISHHDLTAGTLRVTHCANPACTAATSFTVDSVANRIVGKYSSLAIGTDGFPIISHHDTTGGDLRVTHCADPICGSSTSAAVDAPPNKVVGAFSSLAIGSDGLAVISHYDATAGALRFTRCENVACSTAESETVDDPPNLVVGESTSVAIGSDGFPIISHRNVTAAALRVTHCNDLPCTAPTSTTVDDLATSVAGQTTSIAIGVDGLPVVSHRDAAAEAVRVTRCSNITCTAARSQTVDDQSYSVGFFSSLAIGSDGLPVIGHHDSTFNSLRVTHCLDVSCGSSTSTTVDSGSVGLYASLAIGSDGLPVVSYYSQSAGALRVSKCASRTCQ